MDSTDLNDYSSENDPLNLTVKVMIERGLVSYTPKGIPILKTDIDISDVDGTLSHYKNGGLIYGIPLDLTKPYWTRRLKNWLRERVFDFNHSKYVPNFLRYKIPIPNNWSFYPYTKVWVDKDHHVVRFSQENYW